MKRTLIILAVLLHLPLMVMGQNDVAILTTNNTAIIESSFSIEQLGLPNSLHQLFEYGDVKINELIATALLPFALIYLLLFFYHPKERSNLFFAMTVATSLALSLAMANGIDSVNVAFLPFLSLFVLRLVYSLFTLSIPNQFRWFVWYWIAASILLFVVKGGSIKGPEISQGLDLVEIGLLLLNLAVYPPILAETIRVILKAISTKQHGSVTMALGLLVLIGGQLAYVMIEITGYAQIPFGLIPAQLPVLGVLGFVLASSIHLAASFARSYRMLDQCTDELAVSKKRLQEAKQSTDLANKTKNLFLANMGHEVRTPMNAILGYSQILKRDSELPLKHRAAVESIEKSGDHLLAMINDILDLSNIETGRMDLQKTDFDLGSLIESLIAKFRLRCNEKRLNLKVEWDIPETPEAARRFGEFETVSTTHAADSRPLLPTIPLNGDEGKLRHVLVNLLCNAVKFTDRGSIKLRISLFASTEFSKRDSGAPHPDQDESQSGETSAQSFPHIYRFEVIDTGAGISHGAQLRLFEPFRQEAEGLKKGGTGLGLVLSHRQVELMGGNLLVQSEIDKGSKFYFDVPLEPAHSKILDKTASPAKEVSHLAPGYSVNVLVVDDVQENRDILMQLLSGIGCRVRVAENGHKALNLLRKELPQIVFMDIRMPGMWGDEALKRISSEFGDKKPHVVALSASALAHERESYMKAGFDEFLSKPVRFDLICNTLWRLLNVEFEYSETYAREAREIPIPDPNRTSIPGYVLEQLREAADRASATRLERAIQELEKIEAGDCEVASFLRHLAGNGNLEAVSEFLGKVKAR